MTTHRPSPELAVPVSLPSQGERPGDEWVQVGIATAGRPPYAELAPVVREWLADGVVSDFFFMHKPPGLRVRFAVAPGRAPWVRDRLRELTGRWRAAGLVTGARLGVYEPEEQLFGGPVSMRHVHRLFTVDATTWLDFHAAGSGAPAWALSLAMLRPVFAGLHIAGWEQCDTWGRVARAGRELPPGGPVDTGVADVALRRWWNRPVELAAALPVPARRLADRHANRVAPLLRDWRRGYFDTEDAVLGPRQACAFYTVFHWNRAALSYGRQVLIAGALSAVGHVE